MQTKRAEFSDRVTTAHIDLVRNLAQATGRFTAEEVAIAAELVEERLQRGDASGYFFLFAYDRERVVGYSCYGPIPATQGRYDLYWIVVEPKLQGMGLGTRVLKAAENDARARGAKRMYVDTSSKEDYAPTRRFYEHAGYTLAASLDGFYSDSDSKCIYMKHLD